MAISCLDLTTVTDVMRYPGLGDISDTDKDWLLQLVRAISKRAEQYTGRYFYTEARTEKFDSTGTSDALQLPAFGVSSNAVSAVKEDLDRTFGSGSELGSGDYFFDPKTGILWRDAGVWLAGRGVIEVTWTGGVGTHVEDVPDDLRAVSTIQCAFWYQRRFDLGLASKRAAGDAIDMQAPSKLLPEVEEVFDSYRILR